MDLINENPCTYLVIAFIWKLIFGVLFLHNVGPDLKVVEFTKYVLKLLPLLVILIYIKF